MLVLIKMVLFWYTLLWPRHTVTALRPRRRDVHAVYGTHIPEEHTSRENNVNALLPCWADI